MLADTIPILLFDAQYANEHYTKGKLEFHFFLLISFEAALVSLYFFCLLAAVIVLGKGALFLLFVLLSSQRVSRHSCDTL